MEEKQHQNGNKLFDIFPLQIYTGQNGKINNKQWNIAYPQAAIFSENHHLFYILISLWFSGWKTIYYNNQTKRKTRKSWNIRNKNDNSNNDSAKSVNWIKQQQNKKRNKGYMWNLVHGTGLFTSNLHNQFKPWFI